MATDYYPPKSKKNRNKYWDDLTLIDYANEHPSKDDVYEDARCAVNDDILDQERIKRLRRKPRFRKEFKKEEKEQARLAKKTRKEIERKTLRRVYAKRIRRRFSLSCFLFPFVSAIIWGCIGYVLKSMMEFYFPFVNPLYLLGACLLPAALFLLCALKALLFGGQTIGSTLFLYIVGAILIIAAPAVLIFVVSEDPMAEYTAFFESLKATPIGQYLPF